MKNNLLSKWICYSTTLDHLVQPWSWGCESKWSPQVFVGQTIVIEMSWNKETTSYARNSSTVQLTVYGSYSHNAFPIGHRYALTGITWITRFIDGRRNVQMSCSSWHYNIKLLVQIENTLAAGQIGWKFKMFALFSHLHYSYSQVCKWYNSIWFR